MNKIYFLLLIHFLVCIVILAAMPYISTIHVLPYTFIGISFITTVFLVGLLFMRYPTERMNPFTLLSIIYPLQFSVSLYMVKYHEMVSRSELMRYYSNIDEINLLNALKLSYIFSFITLAIAFTFSMTTFWSKALVLVRRALVDERKLLAVVVFGITLTELILIVSGKVTLQGESLIGKDKQNLEVNPIVALINPIACLAAFIAGYQYASTKNKQILLLLFIQFIWFFLWGRRQIVFFSFLVFIGFYFDKKIILETLRIKGIQRVMFVGFIFFLVLVAANFYQQLRTIGGVAVLQNVSLQSLQKVFQLYQSSDSDELKNASAFNLEIRALSTVAAVAHYEKLTSSRSILLGNGEEIYNNFLKSTPSNFFVDKSSILVMEGLASKLTNGKVRPHKDLGGTIILESMIDFGSFGVVLYPVFMTIIIIGFWWCLLRIGSSIVILWFVIALLYSILSMLEGSIGEMFLAMRATIVVVVVYTTIWFMRRIMKGNGALRYDQMA